jgi:probable F420-dependent oxidoreductase
MTIDIGRVGIWTGALDSHPAGAVRDAALELEALGFATLWIPEAVGRDPFVLAANVLGATSTLRMATGIANIYARDPMTMNAGQRSLAEAYPDRFLLGLGVSHLHLVEHVRKHSYDKPLSYMRTYLEAMAKARYFAVGPAEQPPIVLAALGPKMLELAAATTAGAHPYFVPVEHTAYAREVMGRDALLAPEQMVVLETDATSARATARAGMKVYMDLPNYKNNLLRHGFTEDDFTDGGSDRLVDAIVAWGPVERIAERVRAHHDAGADHVCVQVLRPDRELPRAEWRQLADALL